MRSRRDLIVPAALVAAMCLGLVAWEFGSRVTSPEQAAADAAPPDPSNITAPVERRVLSATLITRANVAPVESTPVPFPVLDGQGASDVVTGLFVEPGADATEGAPIAEVAGAPVFVFLGDTPAFRPLRPGVQGKDVEQLQAGLVRLGCPAGDSGEFDSPTKLCVEQLYTDHGYRAQRASETETEDLGRAADAVALAQDAVDSAALALLEGQKPPSAAELKAAQSAVDLAFAHVQEAVAQRDPSIAAAVRAAQDDALSRADAVTVAQAAVVEATASGSPSAIAAAQATLNDAQRQFAAATAASATAADSAARAADDAIAAARVELDAAQAALAAAIAPAETAQLELQLHQQEAALARAQQDLIELEVGSGPIIPLGCLVFMADLPARVLTVDATVGSGRTNDSSRGDLNLMTLGTSQLHAVVEVPASSAPVVQQGTQVRLLNETTGVTVSGTVSTRSAEAVVSETSGQPVIIANVDADFPEAWAGVNVRATFTSATTAGRVLVVPLAAVSSSAGGETRVQVELPDKSVKVVAVEVGLSADGYVQVTPVTGSDLQAGDLVVIG